MGRYQGIGVGVTTPEFGAFAEVIVLSRFFIKLRIPEELTEIEEMGKIKGYSNLFEVILKYWKNLQGLLPC